MRNLLVILLLILNSCTTLGYVAVYDNACPEQPEVINNTDTWNRNDQLTYIEAMNRGCIRHYGENSCLLKFWKLDTDRYSVLCGNRGRK